MKKVLVLMGSPRKGETFAAVERFIKELNTIEETEFELIMLGQTGLKDCTGCHHCITKGQEFCHENKKLEEIRRKMLSASGVILATPVYNQHVTALLKKFMDYHSYLWHRPGMFGVKFMGISSGGGMFAPVFKYLKMNVDSWGGQWIGGLGVAHYESLTHRYKKKTDDEIKKMAQKFYQAIQEKKLPVPTFTNLLWFQMWKLNAQMGKGDQSKDFRHWTQMHWMEMNYYYPVKIGWVKSMGSKLAIKLMKRFLRRVYQGYDGI